jgi:hypothetical protein
MKKRILGIALALGLAATSAVADDARPVTVNVKEREPGAFLVQWQVPQVLPRQAMPIPVLPDSCSPQGERTVVDRAAAWLNRQSYRCEEGLAGKTIGIRYPILNPSLTTFLRVDFLSGERFAHVLGPTEESWTVPDLDKSAFASALEGASRAVLAGIAHVFSSGVDICFLFALCLLGGLDRSLRLVTTFAGAQLLVAIALGLSGLSFEGSLREVCLAVAAVLLAAEGLREPSERRQIRGVVVAAGLVHGAGVPLFGVLGMDAAMVVLTMGVTATALLMTRRIGLQRIRRIAVYAIGGLAVASALTVVFSEPVDATATPRSRLPVGASPTTGAALPGSRPIAPQIQDAALQSFVSVEAFEVRHEVLVRLESVVKDEFIEIEAQPKVKERIAELVLSSASVSIDGGPGKPVIDRVDFVTVGPKGVFPRTDPVREVVSEAQVGVTVAYVTPRTPQGVPLEWKQFLDNDSVPTTVIDPESTQTVLLTPEQAALRWENQLSEDPAPTVAAVAVDPPILPVPLVSLALLAVAGILAFTAARGRRAPLSISMALARVVLALALVAGPLANVSIALPSSLERTPSKDQTRRILAGVLPNVYRAFEFREESAAYDRLAVSVTGETLTEVYLEHRRALEMEERGGARARVEAVEVQEVRSVEPVADGGFAAEASWTVGGTVTHFGHRHFRQNRYDTRVEVVPVDGTWKIRSVEVLEEERLR